MSPFFIIFRVGRKEQRGMKQNNVELNDILRDIFTTPLGELLRRDREREEQSRAKADSKEQS